MHRGGPSRSQPCTVQVRGMAQAPVGIWVRWPRGRTTQAKVPAGAREISVEQNGELKLLR